MFTDPKSGDYLAWFYCTREKHRGQIAHLTRRELFEEPDADPGRGSIRRLPVERNPAADILLADSGTTGIDIAALLKRTRLQIDRHPAWLRTVGPVKREPTCPNEATFQLQTFVGGLAHHFNNLFMVIQGNLSLLRMLAAEKTQHRRRFKRMESLIHCESMLTNDLLGPVVDPRYRCNAALQTRILGEIILIAEQIRPTGKNLCVFPVPLDMDFVSGFLPRLAGGIAVILQQVMVELYGHCKFLLADLTPAADETQRLRSIIAKLRRGMRWAGKLAEYSGVLPGEEEAAESDQLVEIIFDAWTRSDRRVSMNLDCKGDPVRVGTGPKALQRIFEELFDNAEWNCPDDAAVSVHVEVEETGIRVTVADPGPGIPENLKAAVCLPFFSTRTLSGRCGLGLASVDGLLRAAGGEISISTEAGAGAAVTCRLPSSAACASPKAGRI